MDIVIGELKNIALSGSDIYNACEKNIKILKYSDLNKYDNIDSVFDPYDAVALLYELRDNYGHWVLLLRNKKTNTIEFFDSMGTFIDDEQNYINKDFFKKSGQKEKYLSELLVKSKYNIIYNKTKIQEDKKGISSCGRHVSLRYLMRDIPLDDYINIIKTKKQKNADDIVTCLTAYI